MHNLKTCKRYNFTKQTQKTHIHLFIYTSILVLFSYITLVY
jgi:hypothetical protein